MYLNLYTYNILINLNVNVSKKRSFISRYNYIRFGHSRIVIKNIVLMSRYIFDFFNNLYLMYKCYITYLLLQFMHTAHPAVTCSDTKKIKICIKRRVFFNIFMKISYKHEYRVQGIYTWYMCVHYIPTC